MFNWHVLIDKIELGLLFAMCFFMAWQLYYLIRLYLPVLFYNYNKKGKLQPLSVIICARNEAENLDENLKYVLEQDYHEFEVIVVNDCSTDNTDEVLGRYISEYKNLRITSIPLDRKFSHGKKLAITVGIKAAKFENLVFTDADCVPVGKKWLENLQKGIDNSEIVLGYGAYKQKFGLLNNYIRFDTLNIALQYIGFALAGRPYMGVGRNLAYRKKLFFDNKGFSKHYGIISGDDDLFINEVANKKNTAVIIDKDSFTVSEPKNTWAGFFNQKMRHFLTANKYKSGHIFLLGMEPLSRMGFYLLFGVLFILKAYITVILSLVIFRFIIQLFIYAKAGSKFNEKNLWMSFIIFDIFSLFFNFLAYLALALRSRKIRWK